MANEEKTNTSGSFRVLPPVFRDFGRRHKFAGPVVTVRCFEDNALVKAMLDTSGLVETAQGAGTKVIVRVPKFAPGVHVQ